MSIFLYDIVLDESPIIYLIKLKHLNHLLI